MKKWFFFFRAMFEYIEEKLNFVPLSKKKKNRHGTNIFRDLGGIMKICVENIFLDWSKEKQHFSTSSKFSSNSKINFFSFKTRLNFLVVSGDKLEKYLPSVDLSLLVYKKKKEKFYKISFIIKTNL